MADCIKKEMKLPGLMEVVIEGKGLILNTPFKNEIRYIDGELRMDNIRNRKKVMIEEESKLDQDYGRQELKRTRLADDRNQGGATGVVDDQNMTQFEGAEVLRSSEGEN